MSLHAPQNETLTFRSMNLEDYTNIVRKWMVTEGWNPGKFDERIYFSGETNQRNFFVLQLGNTIVAALMVYTYRPKKDSEKLFSFFGAYITHKEYRGHHYGITLWKQVMERILVSTICAYAVPQQLTTYQKSGFTGFFDTHRWSGFSHGGEFKSQNINKITVENITEVNEYDKKIFSADRKAFLQALLDLPSSNFLCSHNCDGKITGLAAIRPVENGYRIGPVEADDPKSAIDLILELLTTTPSEQYIFLDTDSRNPYIQQLAEYFSLQYDPDAKCIAIYKGDQPDENNIEKKFALLSMEFG